MKDTKRALNLGAVVAMVLVALAWSVVRARPAEVTVSGEEARKRMETARDEIANVRSNVFLTLLQLDRVRGERDPQQPQFQVFTNQLGRMEELAQAVGKRAEEMKQRGEAYFLDWEARTAAIQNPEARQRAEKRYVERKACYDGINKFMQDAKANFISFMTDLKGIKATLEAGRDEKSIAKAKELFMHANWRCIDVQRALMEIEDRFDRLAASFAQDE